MALDFHALHELLQAINGQLLEAGRLCLIGSSATILLGQDARQTENLDVWVQASAIREAALKRACEAAGLSFDPKDAFPSVPYLQLVHPGLVQVPGWNAEKREWFGESERVVWQGEHLTVTVPPPTALLASKLVRGEPQDLEDCLWLMAAHAVEAEAIRTAIRALPKLAGRQAAENMEFLTLLRP